MRRHATATPARVIAPPMSARSPGVSDSAHQLITIVTGGTRYVNVVIRPAVVRVSAYAHVVNAIAVGKTPR
jgi:hypothetical protein